MKGKIHFESELNKGSNFNFIINLKKENLILSRTFPRTTSEELFEASKFLILVVEDNDINLKVTVKFLQKFNSIITTAVNGKEALIKLENNNFDLILMDCQMPVLDEYQTTKIIRKSGNKIKIIALTANAMTEDRAKCLEAGMDDYLSKPFKLIDLENMLKKWLIH